MIPRIWIYVKRYRMWADRQTASKRKIRAVGTTRLDRSRSPMSLLETQTLEPGYPQHVSVETAWKWLRELGFTVMDQTMLMDTRDLM